MTTLHNIEMALRSADRPLTRSELRMALDLQADDTSCFYLLTGRLPFVEVDSRRLGLADRDIPGGMVALRKAVDAIARRECRSSSDAHTLVTSLGGELSLWNQEMAASAYRIRKVAMPTPDINGRRDGRSELLWSKGASGKSLRVNRQAGARGGLLATFLPAQAGRKVSAPAAPSVSVRTRPVTPSELATVSLRGSPRFIYLTCFCLESGAGRWGGSSAFEARWSAGREDVSSFGLRMVRPCGLGSEKS